MEVELSCCHSDGDHESRICSLLRVRHAHLLVSYSVRHVGGVSAIQPGTANVSVTFKVRADHTRGRTSAIPSIKLLNGVEYGIEIYHSRGLHVLHVSKPKAEVDNTNRRL